MKMETLLLPIVQNSLLIFSNTLFVNIYSIFPSSILQLLTIALLNTLYHLVLVATILLACDATMVIPSLGPVCRWVVSYKQLPSGYIWSVQCSQAINHKCCIMSLVFPAIVAILRLWLLTYVGKTYCKEIWVFNLRHLSLGAWVFKLCLLLRFDIVVFKLRCSFWLCYTLKTVISIGN